MIGSKIIKPGGAEPDDFEKSIAQALLEMEANSDLRPYLRDLHITRAREIEFGNKKAIIIYVPIPQQKTFQKIQIILVRELEKKFSGKHVVVIGERKILPKPTRKARNPLKQKRPRSRTLTAVYDAILEDLVFPAEIVGKRIRVKLDGSQLIKVHLDKNQQTTIEHKGFVKASTTASQPHTDKYFEPTRQATLEMCLSTTAKPEAAASETNDHQPAQTCTDNCPTKASDSCCSPSTTGFKSGDCSHSIKQRKSQHSTDPNKFATDPDTKDLTDSLGYKEENAVYKEITHVGEVRKDPDAESEYRPRIRWLDLTAQVFLHVGGLYGLYLLFSAKLYTIVWAVIAIWGSGIGITAGAHRLWSHKSYSASLSLRVLLIFLFTIAGQRDAYTWALDHRIHHKFSETEADPHNAKRGFFFAHVGWLFLTPHPKVIEKRKVIDMSDLERDAVVMFQRKWFIPLFAICSIGIPVLVPWYFWDESLWLSFWVNFNMRFCCTLNAAFLVNSLAHMWGRKPYDKNISPVEAPLVSFLALGEGWHNYHHVFPWDYKTGEFGNYTLNVTTAFIDFCARLGLASGRKSVSPDMIRRRAEKCGDGSRFLNDDYAHKDQVWGAGDRDMLKEDVVELAKMKK